ncbi:hypothetical protein KEM60_01586 [Austwickia sp. TVS 96-490-7B]|nr:hypothetical protein [Austwickia sp. TVS 96-490-7B]MBW3085386.1 hypothetical protein [Austwickia sp. TVS 96-490-7B]
MPDTGEVRVFDLHLLLPLLSEYPAFAGRYVVPGRCGEGFVSDICRSAN